MQKYKKMEKKLTDIIRERNHSIYTDTADRFNTTYKYVWIIANGKRRCVRGKGKQIKEYLEQQIQQSKK